MEQWRDIPGHPGYQASDLGRVRSVDRVVKTVKGTRSYRGKSLSPGVASNGYLTVALKKGNSVCVHVAVALAFVGPQPFDGAEVRHNDDIRTHNVPSNLSWGSRGDNGRDKKWNKGQLTYKLSPAEVSAVKQQLSRGAKPIRLAEKFGVSVSTICSIRDGRTHRDVD